MAYLQWVEGKKLVQFSKMYSLETLGFYSVCGWRPWGWAEWAEACVLVCWVSASTGFLVQRKVLLGQMLTWGIISTAIFCSKDFVILCRKEGLRQSKVHCGNSQTFLVAKNGLIHVSKISWCRCPNHKTSRLTADSSPRHIGGLEMSLLYYGLCCLLGLLGPERPLQSLFKSVPLMHTLSGKFTNTALREGFRYMDSSGVSCCGASQML